MRVTFANLSRTILVTIILSAPIAGQNTSVQVRKLSTFLPKACESVLPATVEGALNTAALVKEAICKGAGDMMGDYTFVVDAVRRQKDKAKVKEERITSEVFFPTLKSGARTRGVLVVTSRNQVPVPPAQLEKERLEAAERIEKEETKLARERPTSPEGNSHSVTGMMPLGMYTQTIVNDRGVFGDRSVGAMLAVDTFLKTCELTLMRREKIDGRETLIFNFVPRPDATFTKEEKYITRLRGEIWIDAQDRIVTRLVGWPANAPAEQTPVVEVGMMRLPQHNVWLPLFTRINGADYRSLFGGLSTDFIWTFSNYIRFSSEITDVKVGTPSNQ